MSVTEHVLGESSGDEYAVIGGGGKRAPSGKICSETVGKVSPTERCRFIPEARTEGKLSEEAMARKKQKSGSS